MTKTTTTAAPAITLKASELRALTTPVLPFTSADHMFPVLAAVLLRVHGDYVTATATDRFRLGVMRLQTTVADEADPHKRAAQSPDFRALVRTGDLKRILTVFKPTRDNDPVLTLTVRDDYLEVAQMGFFDGLTAGASLRVHLEAGDYPKVAKLLSEALTYDGERITSFAVNAAYLADFRHAMIDRGDRLEVTPGPAPSKPVLVRCGDHFVGAVMPTRLLTATADTTAEWVALLDAADAPTPAAEEKPKTARKTTRKRAAAVPA